MPNMKVLALTVGTRSFFEKCPSIPVCEIGDPTTYDYFPLQGHNLKYFCRASLDDATCQI